jgi:hypothetical protein
MIKRCKLTKDTILKINTLITNVQLRVLIYNDYTQFTRFEQSLAKVIV